MDKVKLLTQLYIICRWFIPIVSIIIVFNAIFSNNIIDVIQSLFIGATSFYLSLYIELQNGQ